MVPSATGHLDNPRTDLRPSKHRAQRISAAAEETLIGHERLNTLADNAPAAFFEYMVAAGGTISIPYFGARLHGANGP